VFIEQKQLNDFILDSGLVSKAEFALATEEAEQKSISVGDLLVRAGKISEDDLRRMQAYVLGIPFVSLKDQKIPFDTLSLIPEPIARNHNIVAFKRTEAALEVAMLDTDDLAAIEFIKKKVGLKILPCLTDTESVRSALLQYQKSLKAEFGDLIQKDASSLPAITTGGPVATASESELKKLAEDLPVVRIVDTLLKHAILQGASDIHIEPMEKELLVRYRIDGLLHDAMVLPTDRKCTAELVRESISLTTLLA